MIFSYILIYELVFHTTSGASQPGPPPTFKCRYRTACCNSVQKHTASVSFTSFTSFTSAVFGHRSFKQWLKKECDFLEVTRAVLNPVLDFLEATIFHTCASHIFKTPASRSIFENHRKPIFEIVIFTYCHNASHVFTLYTCSPYVHFYITPSQCILRCFHVLRFTRLAILV